MSKLTQPFFYKKYNPILNLFQKKILNPLSHFDKNTLPFDCFKKQVSNLNLFFKKIPVFWTFSELT